MFRLSRFALVNASGRAAVQRAESQRYSFERYGSRLFEIFFNETEVERYGNWVYYELKLEFHKSFGYTMDFINLGLFLCVPFVLLYYEYVVPSKVLVYAELLDEQQYREWFETWWISASLTIQLTELYVFYYLSAHLRLPFYTRVLAPLWRKAGWVKTGRVTVPYKGANERATASATADELKRTKALHRNPFGAKPNVGKPIPGAKKK